MPPAKPPAPAVWTFLTNHATILMCIAADPAIRMRDIAARVGITERAVQRVVAELEAAGYVTIHREGRRNRYVVNSDRPMRQGILAHRTVREFLHFVTPAGPVERKA